MALVEIALSLLDLRTCLIFLTVLLVTWYLVTSWLDRGKNLPPGPRGLFQFMLWNIANYRSNEMMDQFAAIDHMRKSFHSDIFLCCAGSSVGVILSTYDQIKEAFSKRNDLVDRPHTFLNDEFGRRYGLVSSNGRMWKEQRRYVLSKLKDFGMGKNLIEQSILEEAQEMTSQLSLYKDQEVDLEPCFGVAVSNVISSIVFGERHPQGNTELLDYVSVIDAAMSKATLTSLATDLFPILQYIPGDLFNVEKVKDSARNLREYARRKVDQHKAGLDPNDVRCLVDAYLLEIEKEKEDPETTFSEYQLEITISDLVIAGTETTVTSLKWVFLYMILNPTVQEKVQREIDEVIGRERHPAAADRTKMPYTDAVLNESMRCAPIAPFALPHGNVHSDVKIEGYDVPRQMLVIGNMWAVHHDKEYWQYPDEFNPGNFLDEEGNLLPRDRFIPFMIGKRSCPGEALAKMELFIYFVAMLQRFTFQVPAGSPPPSAKGELRTTYHPKPYKVHIQERSN